MSNKKLKIGIDARFYGPTGKGLGRYTQELVDNLIEIDYDNPEEAREYVIFLSPDNYDEFQGMRPGIKKVVVPYRWYSWAEQLFFPFLIAKEKLDLMHFPHFNVPLLVPAPFVVTIHDLILTHFKTPRASTRNRLYYHLKELAYRLVILSAVKRAKKIITVSNFTKNDIISKFGAKEASISVTYEGVATLSKGRDSLFVSKLDSQEVLDQYKISGDFLLYVGNAYPHKNLEGLLRVFNNLHQERRDLRLVLVGKSDYFYERLKEYAKHLNLWQPENLNSPVIFPGYVPDAQLEAVYSRAKAYVFPSFYEGFGLPPLEAMANLCPVVCSNSSSLPEILGEAALYFNPEDETDFLAKLKMIIDDLDLREKLVARGTERIKLYSWWECARETLDVYKQVLKK